MDKFAGDNAAQILFTVASELSEEAKKHGKPTHWLCELLADTADAIDPATISGITGELFTAALKDANVPDWVAETAGHGISRAVAGALPTLEPNTQLALGLRIVGAALCPKPESCPADSRLSTPVIQAGLADGGDN